MHIHEPGTSELSELPRVIVLAGPTGVGKTALSLGLAEALDAEIVGMDSVQIYRGMDIGSAKASVEERARVPHHLIDVLDPDQEHNVGDYKRRAMDAIADIHQRGKHAIIVGGTGLYLRVLIHGLLEAPEPDEELRRRHRERAAEVGCQALHAELAQVDPELAERLHHNDFVRISRGLEIWEQTGRPLSELQREHQFRLPNYNAFKLALCRPRAELYERINARVDQMMTEGFLDECRGLFDRYPRELKVFSSLGYKQMAEHLLDDVPLEEALDSMKQQTRRYAKQQLSWLRGEPGVRWAPAPLVDAAGAPAEGVVEDCRRFLESGEAIAPEWTYASDKDIE